MTVVVRLADARAQTCGGKAGTLGALVRAGVRVPDGVVLTFAAHRTAVGAVRPSPRGPHRDDEDPVAALLPASLLTSLADALEELGGHVAVRSSASDEDGPARSAAGQFASVLGVTGLEQIVGAVRTCWASLHSPRAVAYREGVPGAAARTEGAAMAVLVQRHVDADVCGVMFTPGARDDVTRIEASWGLGPSVVEGAVTPDAYVVHPDATVTCVLGDKATRLDRVGAGLVARDVPEVDRSRRVLDDPTARELARLGTTLAQVLGSPQDVEWAIADGRIWVLQSRPVTASLPVLAPVTSGAGARQPTPDPRPAARADLTLRGTPGSRGAATGPARVVRGPQDFAAVARGDVLVCPWTDPAWTPLLGIVAGVVTETGGALSHAAIVARERGIPAVLGVERATARLAGTPTVVLDGDAGTVTVAD